MEFAYRTVMERLPIVCSSPPRTPPHTKNQPTTHSETCSCLSSSYGFHSHWLTLVLDCCFVLFFFLLYSVLSDHGNRSDQETTRGTHPNSLIIIISSVMQQWNGTSVSVYDMQTNYCTVCCKRAPMSGTPYTLSK